jgi:RimJ/RimL family protein N-acetyltransferase
VLEVSNGQEINNRWYRLRPLGFADISVIAKWLEDIEDLAMFDRRLPVPLDVAAMEAEWRSDIEAPEPRTSYWFKIDDDQGETIGMAGLTQISYIHGNALMPIFIAEGARGQGIGLRTRALLLDLAFDQLRLVRITSLHRADNVASHRLNESCAFKQEGCIRNGCYAGGRHVDQMIFGILAEEWRAHRNVLRAKLSSKVVVSLGNKPNGVWSWPGLPQCEDSPGDEP